MKRFKFRLESIKRLREHEKQAAQLRVAQALQALAQLGAARAETVHEMQRIAASIADGSSSRDLQGTVFAYRSTSNHLDQLDLLIIEQEERLRQTREQYFETHRQTETLSRLESKAHDRHQAEQASEEQKQIDELAIARSAR